MIFGLIGEKLSHSYSPQIHKAFFEITGIKGEYRLFPLPKNELQGFLHKALNEGFMGLNVTIPYKTDIMAFLSRLSTEAEKIGAVNTITLQERLEGYNTDYFGIDYTLRKNNIPIKGKKALITGTGGSAKAVSAYLMDSGIEKLVIAGRNPARDKDKFPASELIEYHEITQYGPFDIIINTTPVGMFPYIGQSPLCPEQVKGAGFVFDLIYNPEKTELMKIADALGIPGVNGLYMLVTQAVKAQEIWQGKAYGLDMVDAILLRMSEEKRKDTG